MLTQYQRIARLCRQRLILEGEPVSWRREGSTEPELFLRSKPDGMVPSSEAIAYMPTFFLRVHAWAVSGSSVLSLLWAQGPYNIHGVLRGRNRKFVPAAMGAGEGHPSPWQPITMLVSAAMEQSAVACWGQRLRRLVPVSGIKR